MPSIHVPPECPSSAAARYEQTLQHALSQAAAGGEVWIFGYASLIWRPEFEATEVRPARLLGWHRSLRMLSRVNRGTVEQPGLVFALFQGGACRGMAYRLCPSRAQEELVKLWSREMPMAVYEPRWLPCRTEQGTVRALTFTLKRSHTSYTGALDDEAMIKVLSHATGRYGSTLDYLLQTHVGLLSVGICDREIARLVTLAQRAKLIAADAVPAMPHTPNARLAAKQAPSNPHFSLRLDASTA